MLTHTLIRSMQRGAQFLVGGLCATIVLFSAIIGLEVSVGTARSGAEGPGKP
jgi:hypothetical protein